VKARSSRSFPGYRSSSTGFPEERSPGRTQAARSTPCALIRGSCRPQVRETDALALENPVENAADLGVVDERVVSGHGKDAALERGPGLVVQVDGKDERADVVAEVAGYEPAPAGFEDDEAGEQLVEQELW
jgi:hypothetical protein